ncbi:glycosyltransferase family A protein [Burkholderiaceae bacterium UC74_6]
MRESSGVLASIVISTTMEGQREHSLKRAVDSIFESSNGAARPLLVVNGPRVDERLFAYWSSREDVKVVRLPVGDYLKARAHGRRQVDTKYFGFVDDDDHFLPGALSARIAALEADQELACVISNGIVTLGDEQWHSIEAAPSSLEGALHLLAYSNWLPSAVAGLYRTALVGEHFFEHNDRHLEWTGLALRLCLAKAKLQFLMEPGFSIEDTAGSLSKSHAYHAGLAGTLARLIKLDIPQPVRNVWLTKYTRLLHELSTYHLQQGRRWPAFTAHLRSLCHPGGLSYLAYTRHLVLPIRR